MRNTAILLAACCALPRPAVGQNPAEMKAGIRLFTEMIFEHHPDPYRLYSRAEWDQAIERAVAGADSLDEAGLFVELSRLTGMLRDGHSFMWIDDDSELMGAAMPLAFWEFADGVFVRAAHPDHAGLVGARVDSIGGAPMEEAWARLTAARPGENDWMAAKAAAVFMRIPDYLRVLGLAERATEATLSVTMPDGATRRVAVPAAPASNLSTVWSETVGFATPEGWVEPAPALASRWMRGKSDDYRVERIPEHRALYVQVNRSWRGSSDDGEDPWLSFVDEVFGDVEPEGVERLVVDLRHNRGGDSSMWQALAHGIIRSPTLDRPGGAFVLTSPITESAAAVIATKLETQTRALFVGEPMGSAPNYYNDRRPGRQRESYHVPGSGINFRVMRVVEQRSNYLDTRWSIFPDLSVRMTWADFAAGRDPVLEAALTLDAASASDFFAYSDGTPIVEPWEHPWRASQNGVWPDR